MQNCAPTRISHAKFVRQVLARDPAAEEELFTLIWKIVNAHAHAWGIPARDVEDLACEVVVKVFERLHRFNSRRAKLSTWIYMIGRNHAYDRLRKDKHDPLRREAEELRDWMEIPGAAGGSVDEDAVTNRPEIFDRLDEALTQLSTEDRELLRLSIDEGQTAPQIARILGMKPGQVRVRKLRALHRLREILSVQH